MSINLYCSSNSIEDTKIECDSLGIHYTVSEEGGVISVARWDKDKNVDVLIAQLKLYVFLANQVRLGADGSWGPANDFLRKEKTGIIANFVGDIPRAFESDNGVAYRWESHWNKLTLSLDTKVEKGQEREVLVSYHRNHLPEKQSYLEILDKQVLPGLDYIVATFLIMERIRRDEAKWRYGAPWAST